MARRANEPVLDPAYRETFRGILSFRTFSDAENTIRNLERLRQQFLANHDDKGVRCCREMALLARRRAELISRNRKVRESARRHKAEVARWFQLWLETPDIFESWLALRKATAEFRELEAGEVHG